MRSGFRIWGMRLQFLLSTVWDFAYGIFFWFGISPSPERCAQSLSCVYVWVTGDWRATDELTNWAASERQRWPLSVDVSLLLQLLARISVDACYSQVYSHLRRPLSVCLPVSPSRSLCIIEYRVLADICSRSSLVWVSGVVREALATPLSFPPLSSPPSFCPSPFLSHRRRKNCILKCPHSYSRATTFLK